MKKILVGLVSYSLCVTSAFAGLITHSDYTSGNVITAAGQNTNENLIFNEFNGSINSANIATGGVKSVNILDGTIVEADLSTVIQSSFTAWNNYAAYRRPVLKWISTSSVDVESNDSTSNKTCVFFPDGERRCVTENTSAADKYRRFILTSSASFTTGTEDSGMYGTYASNDWIALYAVKSQVSASNFVIAGTTNTIIQGNISTLNTMFGSNAYTYLGLIRVGNGQSGSVAILGFQQSGNTTLFDNNFTAGGTTLVAYGIQMATTGSAASLAYTSTTGMIGAVIPNNVSIGYWQGLNGAVSSTINIRDGGDNYTHYRGADGNAGGQHSFVAVTGDSIKISNAASTSIAYDIVLYGFVDSALGIGFNPFL